MTAVTGDEFALFTRENERLVIRGNTSQVPIRTKDAIMLKKEGYRWSGHMHPGFTDASLIVSDSDRKVLNAFGQNKSVVYNAAGKYSFVTPRDA